MKMKKLLSVVISVVMVLSLVACSEEKPSSESTNDNSQTVQNTDSKLWADAIYTEDTEIGEGANTVAVVISAGEKTVTVTVKTDETNFGQVLRKSGFVEGSESEYGLYISHVNGIKAVYEEDKAYWSFLDGEGNYMNYGVDSAELTGNDTFQLVYTIG